jgi:predicted lipoprotein with Yx(FWY)xxD motif
MIYAIALLAVIAVAIAGCGGGSSTTSGESGSAYGGSGESESASSEGGYGGRYGGEGSGASSESTSAGSGGGAVVSLASVPKLGMLLVDSEGMTVYLFEKDKGTTSSCYGACAQAWPPVLTKGEPQVGNGAKASLLGTTKRKDGTVQVTYAGHPLYTFVEDSKPGEANGNDFNGFGAEWYALQGNGEKPKDS